MRGNDEAEGTSSMSTCKVVSLLILAVVECLLFGFILDGWPSFAYILKSDGVYSQLCETTNVSLIPSNNSIVDERISESQYDRLFDKYDRLFDTGHRRVVRAASPLLQSVVLSDTDHSGCVDQDAMLNKAFLVSNFIGQGLSGLLGYFFDRFGLRICRLMAAVCFITGVLLMTFKNLALSWLVFPSTILIAIANVMIVLTVSHVALVAGKRQSTFAAIISGAIDLSAFVPAIIQLAFDAGISRAECLYVYTGLFGLHVINTFFVSPKYKLLNEAYSEQSDNRNENNPNSSPEASIAQGDGKPEDKTEKKSTESFLHYALSPLCIIHILWLSVVQLRFWFILGTFNTWLEILTEHNIPDVSFLTLVFEYVHFIVLVLAPIIGLFTDWQVEKANREKEEMKKLLGGEVIDSPLTRARPLVGLIVMATISAIALSISALFWTYPAAYAMSVFTVALKNTMYASHLVFSQIVYPPEHHGKALGFAVTVACAIDLVEIPMFTWAQTSETPFQGAHITLLVFTVLAMIHPLLIWAKNNVHAKKYFTRTCKDRTEKDTDYIRFDYQ